MRIKANNLPVTRTWHWIWSGNTIIIHEDIRGSGVVPYRGSLLVFNCIYYRNILLA